MNYSTFKTLSLGAKDKTQQLVINRLKKEPMTAGQLKHNLGLSRAYIHVLISRLVKKGVIEKRNDGVSLYYGLKEVAGK
jgi:predicted transcriptional regulator